MEFNMESIIGILGVAGGLVAQFGKVKFISEVKEALAAGRAAVDTYERAKADGTVTPEEIERIGDTMAKAVKETTDVVVAAKKLKFW